MKTQPTLQPLAPEHADVIKTLTEYAAEFSVLTVNLSEYVAQLCEKGIALIELKGVYMDDFTNNTDEMVNIISDIVNSIIISNYLYKTNESTK